MTLPRAGQEPARPRLLPKGANERQKTGKPTSNGNSAPSGNRFSRLRAKTPVTKPGTFISGKHQQGCRGAMTLPRAGRKQDPEHGNRGRRQRASQPGKRPGAEARKDATRKTALDQGRIHGTRRATAQGRRADHRLGKTMTLPRAEPDAAVCKRRLQPMRTTTLPGAKSPGFIPKPSLP